MITEENKKVLKGAEFLVSDMDPSTTFIREDFTEEHKMIFETCDNFLVNEIAPKFEEIEIQKEGVSEKLMSQLGELGMLGAHMPEAYGGMDLDFVSNSIIGEEIGSSMSFSVTYNAHTGIGMLPILYFGTDAQKEKYLPKMITAEIIGAYCLTEPSSGSDALSAKTTAVLTEDGKHYILNGQKMWITNAGFAQVFTVFAKIDGEKFTGFIVDRDTPGLSFGAEEKKLGIKGSSTRQVFFENVKIPVDNVLGEIGKGHLIAFNVLNIGRYKLGISCLGGAKKLSNQSIQYAISREQFKQPIANFGAIKHKLAEQAIKIFATDSVSYRIAGIIQDEMAVQKAKGASYADAKLVAAEEYALECSILKILGSETLDYVVDETVQIHGGMGFSEEGLVARGYRDSRINRIFEGTNEINRMLMVNILFKKVMKGEIDLATAAMKVQGDLMNGVETTTEDTFLADEIKCVKNLKKLTVMLLGLAGQQAMAGKMDLKEEQEILMNLSDLITNAFAAQSTLARVIKMNGKGLNTDIQQKITKVLLHDLNHISSKLGMDVVADLVDESMIPMVISGIKKLTKYPVQKVKTLRRDIADKLIASNEYCFQ